MEIASPHDVAANGQLWHSVGGVWGVGGGDGIGWFVKDGGLALLPIHGIRKKTGSGNREGDARDWK